MYVCICHPVTDAEVRQCVRHGACTLSDLQMQLGIASQCGCCASAALAIVQEEKAAQLLSSVSQFGLSPAA